MSNCEVPKPSDHVETGPTRRAVLTVGGGLSLAAFLAACGVRALPAGPAAEASTAGITASSPFVRITTTGATFNPTLQLVAGSTATVSWAVEGGATVTGTNPTIRFGTEATRHVRMTVDDGGADALDDVITFNLGFNHLDDAGTYNMGASHNKAGQAVTRVENVSRLTGLRRFAAAHSALAGSLDFTGCSWLQYIECLNSHVQSVNVTGCTSLIRLVVEQTNLTALDLNPVGATLRDLRGAGQRGGRLTLTPLKTPMAALYHLCVRGQAVVNHPTPAQLPVVEERWDWDTGQSGVLTTASTAIRSLRTFGNHYTTAELADQFPAGRNATLEASSNELTAVNLTGCSGLLDIDLSKNNLDAAAVDGVLALVASWGTSDGLLNLAGNSAPSTNGVASRATLTGRGWTVTTET
jgi:hypothetical protein